MLVWKAPYYLRRRGLSCSTNDVRQSSELFLEIRQIGWAVTQEGTLEQRGRGGLSRALQGTRPYLSDQRI